MDEDEETENELLRSQVKALQAMAVTRKANDLYEWKRIRSALNEAMIIIDERIKRLT